MEILQNSKAHKYEKIKLLFSFPLWILQKHFRSRRRYKILITPTVNKYCLLEICSIGCYICLSKLMKLNRNFVIITMRYSLNDLKMKSLIMKQFWNVAHNFPIKYFLYCPWVNSVSGSTWTLRNVASIGEEVNDLYKLEYTQEIEHFFKYSVSVITYIMHTMIQRRQWIHCHPLPQATTHNTHKTQNLHPYARPQWQALQAVKLVFS